MRKELKLVYRESNVDAGGTSGELVRGVEGNKVFYYHLPTGGLVSVLH